MSSSFVLINNESEDAAASRTRDFVSFVIVSDIASLGEDCNND